LLVQLGADLLRLFLLHRGVGHLDELGEYRALRLLVRGDVE
jgi:hypothetical protein